MNRGLGLGVCAVAALALGAACGEGVVEAGGDEVPAGGARVRGRYIVPREQFGTSEQSVTTSGGPFAIFLNRAGGTYRGGADSPATNASSIVSYYGYSSVTIPPFAAGDGAWNAYLGCMRDTYAAFNVVVTDREPTSGSYIEIPTGGNSQTAFRDSFGGIAPMVCGAPRSAVVFVMAEEYGTDALEMCWTGAQESAHALGLDHELLCADPTTYLSGCALPKRFQDRTVSCGEYSAESCACGGTTQNSHRVLLGKLGPAPSGCPSGQAVCGASCADLASDPRNCGACGRTCASGQVCQSGACGLAPCPAGQTRCGASCAALSSDAANCGACGRICAAGQACQSGSCLNAGDTTPPTVSIVSPADGATLPPNTPMSVSVRATDASGIASASLYWAYTSEWWNCPSTRTGVACSVSGDTATWNFTPGAGDRSFAARATDRAGNAATTPWRTIHLAAAVSKIAVSILSPAAGAAFASGSTFQVAASATSNAAVASATLNWSSPYGSTTYAMSQDASGDWGVGGTFGVVGDRTFSVTVRDAAGATATTAARTISVR